MRSEAPAARCEDLAKTYRTPTGAVHALRGVSARFPRGALTAVVGPSGSGKSSLLRILAGMDHPTSGVVEVEGTRVDGAAWRTLRRLRRERVGYVFQRATDNFFPHLTVRQHLQQAATSGRAPLVEVGDLLGTLGIADRVDHRVSEISGGEQQRAAFACVIAAGARFVIADEPTAELDTTSALGVLGTISLLVGSGVTFVLATHDATVVRAADAVVELEHGVLRSKRRALDEVSLRGRDLSEEGPVPSDGHEDVVVEAREISKAYRRGSEIVHAVRDVDLAVARRELVGLVGRSGSGKTTLLNVVAGWERPDTGTVTLAGRAASDATPRWSEVAVVPQRLGLMEELTIRENVEYPALLDGRLEESRPLVDRLVEAMGLDELQHRYPNEASVGEQQRAALARALVLTPHLILADEPTGHQDRGWTGRMFDALRQATREGTACLTATHDEDVAGYLDRVLAMSDGRLEQRTA
ncbi:MAG: ABC transporter ATP-binding protein [Actinomycetota bacterium]